MKLPSGECYKPHWWFNIGSVNGLEPSDNKSLPEPILTQIGHNMASLGHNKLMSFIFQWVFVKKKQCQPRPVILLFVLNSVIIWMSWACFLSLARSKLRLCSASHRPGYWSNLPCDWPSAAWAYSEQETENRPSTKSALNMFPFYIAVEDIYAGRDFLYTQEPVWTYFSPLLQFFFIQDNILLGLKD